MPIHRYAGAYQYVETTPVAPSTLLVDLAGYWPLNESSDGSAPVTRLDQLGISDLTDNNTCLSAAGKISNAVQIVRANSEYLSCPSNPNLQAGDIDFALSCWANLGSKPAAIMTIVSKDKAGAGNSAREYSIRWMNTVDRFEFNVYENDTAAGIERTVTATTFGAPVVGTWYHIYAQHDATANQISISVNDTPFDTVATLFPLWPPQDAEFDIGRMAYAGFPFHWDGLIDEVGLWKRLLTSTERTTLYNAGAGKAYPFS